MHRLTLTDEEVGTILPLVRGVASDHSSVEEAAFLDSATTYAQELPRRLRAFLNAFRLTEPLGVCIVAGYPVDDYKIGNTPSIGASGTAAPLLWRRKSFSACAGRS
jgi:hypothetical protein